MIDDKGYDLQEILEDRGFQMKLASTDEDILKEIDNVKSNVYDLVLLDIKGILPALYPEEGYGVLKDIKDANPEQKIIAFSNEEFSNQYSEFFHLTDAMLKKDAALPTVASKINTLLYIKYKKAQLLEELKAKLNLYNINTDLLNEKNSITYIPKVIDMLQKETYMSLLKWYKND